MKYYFTLVSMAIIKKPTNCKCWRGWGEMGTLLHCWWECINKLVQMLKRTVWRFLKKLKVKLPCLCACSVTQSCCTLCSLMDCSLPASSVRGISQAILEGVAISYSRGPFQPRNWNCISCIGRRILYRWTTREAPLIRLGALILCAYVYNEYHVLFLYWSLYHYTVSFFVVQSLSCVRLCLKSVLSDMSIATPAFMLFPFAPYIFFHPLTFNLCVSFALKWISWGSIL